MNGAQLHLALNHLPVILSLTAFAILLWGLATKNSEIKKVGQALTVAMAVCAGIAFLTGEPAEDVLESVPGFSKQLVHEHEEAGEAALIAAVVAGLFAAISLYLDRKKHRLANKAAVACLLAIAASSVAFLNTAHLGGVIRHEEIRTTDHVRNADLVYFGSA